jgi:transposase InsO family protein
MVRPALTQLEKEELYHRKQAGARHAEVAQALGCSVETVRKHWQAFRRGIVRRARGRPARGALSSFAPGLAERALALKQAHPHWGPLNVLIDLCQPPAFAQARLPSRSRLSAFFHQRCPEAVQPRRRPGGQTAKPPKDACVHQRWQVDTKEKVRLGKGELASILEIRDPVSAVILVERAFQTTRTLATCRKLSLEENRSALRQGFATWGKPLEVQTDHEDVYAGSPTSDFPTPFTLWLVGLGIEHIFSRRNQPTDQGSIERHHRTVGDLGWKDQPPQDLVALQQQLAHDQQRYNQEYPAQAADCQGQPPLVRHPEAIFSGRPYTLEGEWASFNLARVDQYLARRHWVRKVDRNGRLLLGDQHYSLGRVYKGQRVAIRYLPEARAFRFETEQGHEIQTLPAKGLEIGDLTGLIPVDLPTGLAVQLAFPWGV